jgi:hypothetical protein
MTCEAKLRTLAAANAGLQAIFGTAPCRFFDTQLPQAQAYPSAVVWRVSTAIDYRMDSGYSKMTQPRLQIDVRHPDPEQARAAASAVIDFLGTVNLAVTGGAVTPAAKQAPCFVLNQRTAMDFQLQPPVSVQTLDVRVFNLEEA